MFWFSTVKYIINLFSVYFVKALETYRQTPLRLTIDETPLLDLRVKKQFVTVSALCLKVSCVKHVLFWCFYTINEI